MSTLQDLKAGQDALDAEITAVAAAVAALVGKVGTLPADAQAAIDAEVAALTASTGKLAGTIPAPPPVP